MRFRIILLILFFLTQQETFSQDAHYWFQKVGARASLLNGAVTGSIRDNSALYYNPGAMAFLNNPSIQAQGDLYALDIISIKNGAGEGQDLKANLVDTAPLLLSFVIKELEKPGITLTLGAFNKGFSTYNISHRHQNFYDVIESKPGEEIYVGTYNYYQRKREDWIGLGTGKKFGDNLGIGISSFVVSNSTDYQKSISASAYGVNNEGEGTEPLANIREDEWAELRSVSLIWQIGFALETGRSKIGLNISTPIINLGFLGKSTSGKSLFRDIPSADENVINISDQHSKVKTTHKTPWSFSFGFEYPINIGLDYPFNRSVISASFGFMTGINTYSMLTPENKTDPISGILAPPDPNFAVPQMAHKPVANFAIGVEQVLSKTIKLLLGYNSDRNYFDDKALNKDLNIVPVFSYWNARHISAGITYFSERFDLITGLDFTAGKNKGQKQLVSFTDPKDYNNLLGVRNNNTTTNFTRISFVIGFTYRFSLFQEN